MPSTRTHEVVATIGEYTDAQGQTKKRYINIGSAFTDDQGRISIKLDAVPVSPEWSGWVSLYALKDKEPQQGQQRSQGQQRGPGRTTNPQEAHRVNNAHRQQEQAPWDENQTEGDDIPFN